MRVTAGRGRPGSSLRAVNALRQLLSRPPFVVPIALALRAREVQPSLGFALRELARVHETRSYRLRRGGGRIALRHCSADAVTLGEVFHDADYEPIAEVAPLLDESPTILDLGANIGLFGAFAAQRWPHSRITAYEPDPANAAVHRATLALHGLAERWRLVEAAAGVQAGRLPFLAGNESLSRSVGSGEPGTITVAVEDVLDQIATADLIKMDIEGGEWAILEDPRFRARPPRVLALEYHPHLAPFLPARDAADAALRAAGMSTRHFKLGPAGHGMLWAWRA